MGKGTPGLPGTAGRLARWSGLLMLLWSVSAVAQAGVLYRCADGQGPPRWQQQPCAAGEAQRSLEYVPAPAAQPAAAAPAQRATRPEGRARVQGPRQHSAARRPRADPHRERANAACAQARALADQRSDAQGRRVPLRVVREREKRAREACAR